MDSKLALQEYRRLGVIKNPEGIDIYIPPKLFKAGVNNQTIQTMPEQEREMVMSYLMQYNNQVDKKITGTIDALKNRKSGGFFGGMFG